MKKLFLILSLVMTSAGAWAQCAEYKWPADQMKAQQIVDAYKAAVADQNYKGATSGLQWMLTHAPQWHSDLYVEALEVYDKLAEQELDPATKQRYVDTLMVIYDMRITNCGDEANVLNRKAISAYKFNKQNKTKLAEVLSIFDKTFEANGNNVFDQNLYPYMDVIKNNVDLLKNLNEDQVAQRYTKLIDIIDNKEQKSARQNKSSEVEKYKKVVAAIDAKLAKTVKMNCAFSQKVFEPRFKANNSDLASAKHIFHIGLVNECTDSPIWLEAVEALHKSAPDFTVNKELCSKYIQLKNFDKANPLIDEVQAKATTPAQKAWVDILKGDVQLQQGNKAAARDEYKKALVTDAASKDAYEHLGDLYVSSSTECSKTPGSAEEKLVYIAAFQFYIHSGNREKMEQTLAKYPTHADLAKAGWKAGESKKLACWIDEAVVVKAKKE
ncbi:MAG: tetratricopeptide repeat protein [Bacteroidetes bacterium]|nr:tetratricopeptide repeat protein [Bacteroidota bacterium]MBS1980504.1 tetratricopeptide repeat protein [Bacteroidota bacterium]